jgi:3-oxoacyl-(acyl-carrier-protein) synthase
MSAIISGMGVISAAGRDLIQTLNAFGRGRRNAGPPSLFPTTLPYPVFEADGLASGARGGRRGRTLRLALHAVRAALRDSGLPGDLSGLRVGVCLGSTVSCQFNDLGFYTRFRKSGRGPMAPVDRYLGGELGAAVSRVFKAFGPSFTVANACSSGTDAIGAALSWLEGGVCDIAIAGGADELSRVPYSGFGALSVLSDALCRPFDRDRAGLNLGEGAGVLVLETEESARRRGRKPELVLGGFGAACDAHHLTAPRPDGSGLEAALRKALARANADPSEVCFVNAHGTATRDNDSVEAAVLCRVFGRSVKFFSTKGYTGHTLGAAGGLEAAFTAAGLREGWIPPSAGFENPDPGIPITPVAERTGFRGRFAVSTSLAFGGNNAALVIGYA